MMAEIVKHNKESLSRNRPEIAIAINCKIRVTEIFRLIN